MPLRIAILALALGLLARQGNSAAPDPADRELSRALSETIQPFLKNYCIKCHGGERPKADLNLVAFPDLTTIVADFSRWDVVREKLAAKEMPPADAKDQPSDKARQQAIDWIVAVRTNETVNHAGDPGVVLPRRLSNAEFNYSIRDLTGVDIQPAKEFPIDPTNPAGFDNSGESLVMSPELLTKYLQAARDVANHLVFKPDSLSFAPHPMLVETDRDKYCVKQIVDFYHQQDTDYADYFQAAWRFKLRFELGRPEATLNDLAADSKISPKYLETIWSLLEGKKEEIGPTAKLQAMWRDLPAPRTNQPDVARKGCEQMRDFVVELRNKLEPRFPNVAAGKIGATSQPLLMWKNRQYASHRMTFDRNALQVAGEKEPKVFAQNEPADAEPGADNEFGPGHTPPVKNKPGDPDLAVPAGQRVRYEAAFAEFCAVFPDAFYIEERGRNYFDKTKDRGRLLSAGFHNVMGYFRDDAPLYELLLDEKQQRHLDSMWCELDYIASACARTYIQFYLNEAGDARNAAKAGQTAAASEDKEITSEAGIKRVKENYLTRAGGNQVAAQAVEDHFKMVNDTLRWVEKTRIEAEPRHLSALVDFADRAYRRPLSTAERDELLSYYRSLRDKDGLDHESAIRECVVSVLMSPDFCYRIDLTDVGEAVRPLSDIVLASRLSYFLWSSIPDAELLDCATSGKLRQPEVLVAQARRMLKDDRIRGLAVEFGGNWLDFRRFEELNTVDRERFNSFSDELREAMFEEPIRFMVDVFQNDRSVLVFLYGNHTFVNPVLARHYGMADLTFGSEQWTRVENADNYGRGGILPMAVFLTKNAPGLRTSPVKRGYWVVKRVLGERIPPPPAAVPELPRDEAKLDLPLREALARHREDASCAACHSRFDSLGLVFEGFGPIGQRRDKDLAGRAVDAAAVFPDGSDGKGMDGLRQYLRYRRQDEYVDNLCRKLLSYALGRGLVLSDDPTIEQMRSKLAKNDDRFDCLIESIVTSPQFMNKRGRETVAKE